MSRTKGNKNRVICYFSCRNFPNWEMNLLVNSLSGSSHGLIRFQHIAILHDFESISVSRCSLFKPDGSLLTAY